MSVISNVRFQYAIRYKGAVERKEKILDIIRSLDLPKNPLDDIIDQVSHFFLDPLSC